MFLRCWSNVNVCIYKWLIIIIIIIITITRYRQKSQLCRPVGAGNAYTRRQEPASPVTRTRRLMKRPTAQYGGAR